MHLEHNVPVAIIAAWLGHADTAFTMRTYVHSQPEKLANAAESMSSWLLAGPGIESGSRTGFTNPFTRSMKMAPGEVSGGHLRW